MIVSNYLSIWEVAHRWHGVDPNKTDPSDLPMIVQDTIRHLSEAVLNGELRLYLSDVIPSFDYERSTSQVRYEIINDLPDALHQCAFERKYQKSVLDGI